MPAEANEVVGGTLDTESEYGSSIINFECSASDSETSDQAEADDEGEDSEDANEAEEMDWENGDYTNEKNFQRFLNAEQSETSMESDHEEIITVSTRRASRRATRNNSMSFLADASRTPSTRKRSNIVKIRTGYQDGYSSAKLMDEDDSEEFPTPSKRQRFFGEDSSRLQEATPASSRTVSVQASPENNGSFFTARKATNTRRGQRTGIISFPRHELERDADTTVGPEEPA